VMVDLPRPLDACAPGVPTASASGLRSRLLAPGVPTASSSVDSSGLVLAFLLDFPRVDTPSAISPKEKQREGKRVSSFGLSDLSKRLANVWLMARACFYDFFLPRLTPRVQLINPQLLQ